MNDEEINRAIAEHLGWRIKAIKCGDLDDAYWIPPGGYEDAFRNCGIIPPNYSGDLNAMHEAEKAAFGSSNLWAEFAFQLISVLNASGMSELDGMTCLLQATAPQRAEAFLRVVGKWRGEE